MLQDAAKRLRASEETLTAVRDTSEAQSPLPLAPPSRPLLTPPASPFMPQGADKRLRAAEKRLDAALEAALGDNFDDDFVDDFDALEAAPEAPPPGEQQRLAAGALLPLVWCGLLVLLADWLVHRTTPWVRASLPPRSPALQRPPATPNPSLASTSACPTASSSGASHGSR